MGELINPPEPRDEPDRDTLGDMQHDRMVEAALWNPPVVEPMVVEPAPVTSLIRRECPWCLDGLTVLPGHKLAKCGACCGRGYYLTEET
jgi:hypothetical protein